MEGATGLFDLCYSVEAKEPHRSNLLCINSFAPNSVW